MDLSLYEAPRQPPVPTAVQNIKSKIPTVPEISLLDDGAGKKVRFFGGAKENQAPNCQQRPPDLRGQTFKQIYMANIPDRHLDLSILEPSPPPVEQSPLRNHDFQKLFNRPALTPLKDCSPQNDTLNMAVEPFRTVSCSSKTPSPEKSSEPSIRELYQLIQKQNEQILSLQKQMNFLNDRLDQQQPELDYTPHRSPKLPHHKKFSIDLKATSFEVSFRPQKFRQPQQQATLHEITENSKEKSLRLDEPVVFNESYASAAPSIKINMDNYISSSDESSNGSSEESLGIGPSFYKDLIDQVNHVLKKSNQCDSRKPLTDEAKGQTISAVKQATVQHLRSMGVNLPPIEECPESSNQSEISFAVKQLLMKYLPDHKLAQINGTKQAKRCPPQKPTKQAGEFSFATVQYMQKYKICPPKTKKSDKILDVTALKMQPKLL